MNRKEFLKKLGIGIVGIPLGTNAVIANWDKLTAVITPFEIDEIPLPTNQLDWTAHTHPSDGFDFTLHYLNWLKKYENGNWSRWNKFEWAYTNTPTFKYNNERYIVRTYKSKAKFTPEIAMDLHAFQSINVNEELTGMLFENISIDLANDYKKNKKKIVIYKLFTGPLIYDPENFTPRRSVLIRYGKV